MLSSIKPVQITSQRKLKGYVYADQKEAQHGQGKVIPCFGGPKKETLNASIKEALHQTPDLLEFEYLKSEVETAAQSFVSRLYKIVEDFPDNLPPEIAESMKSRQKDLERIFIGFLNKNVGTEFVALTSNGVAHDIGRLKFLPRNGKIVAFIEDDTGELKIEDIVTLKNRQPKWFSGLVIAAAKIAVAIRTSCDDETTRGLYQLAGIIRSLVKSFGYFNPGIQDRQKQALENYLLLASPSDWQNDPFLMKEIKIHKPYEGDLYEPGELDSFVKKVVTGDASFGIDRLQDPEVDEIMDQTFADIKAAITYIKTRSADGYKTNYVMPLAKALVATERFCHNNFDMIKDVYYSLAGDSATVKGLYSDARFKGKRYKANCSLLKSAVETDPYKGCSFDVVTGYKSAYNINIVDGVYQPIVKTIVIDNPGKYKIRIIHLGCSAVQDRCNYIHRRLAAVLKSLLTDCTKEQRRGTEFLKKITNPENREGIRYSILAYDWTNATDKLYRPFQLRVLSLVFSPEVVDFWNEISTCVKDFIYPMPEGTPDRTLKYHQVNGQPQGLLGSFEAFAFAHHIMMLATMKASNREDLNPEDFYRVLGDDSVICSVTEDRPNLVGDWYCKICHWANCKINRTKSTEVLCQDDNALVEFAKVDVFNGEYFSPIPMRLMTRIGTPNVDYFAFGSCFWMQQHGGNQENWLESIVKHYYPDSTDQQLIHAILYGGTIPFFYDKDKGLGLAQDFKIQEEISLYVTLAYHFSELKAGFTFNLLSDTVKEKFSDKLIEDQCPLESILPPNVQWLLDKIEPEVLEEHKLWKALELNMAKCDFAKGILNGTVDQESIVFQTLGMDDQFWEAVRQVTQIIDYVREGTPIISFRDQIGDLGELLRQLGQLNFRSVYKHDTRVSMVMRAAVQNTKLLFGSQINDLLSA